MSSAGPGDVVDGNLDVALQTRLLAAEFMLRAHMLDERKCTYKRDSALKSVKDKGKRGEDESSMQVDEMPFDADVQVSSREGLSRRVRHLEGVLYGGWVVISREEDAVRLVRPRFDSSGDDVEWKTMADKMRGVMDEKDILGFGFGVVVSRDPPDTTTREAFGPVDVLNH